MVNAARSLSTRHVKALRSACALVWCVVLCSGLAQATEAQLQVSAVVKEFFTVQPGTASAVFEVTQRDITQGFVDSAASVDLEIRTNTRRDVLVNVQALAGDLVRVRAAEASGFDGAGATLTLIGSGSHRRESIRLAARMRLTPLSSPGLYRMPLHVEVMPL